ncbi:MAG: prolyl oligopeptidase family serine peptidase [Clostridia bacterium]|nr:prolyl oligopeptidase family serine peptidase [Clostridia bacterium]
MKKVLSILLCAFLLLATLVLPAGAASIQEGSEKLELQFADGESSGGIDYCWFSPVKSSFDISKYPLIVWLHGGNGYNVPRSQIKKYDVGNLVSDEYQAKFSPGGCFVLAPRDPAVLATNWEFTGTAAVKAVIDEFIEQNQRNIDTSRIYIIGYSIGGSMVWKMLEDYPTFFAAAIPASALIQPSESAIKKLTGTAIWIFCSDEDPYPGARTVNVNPVFQSLRVNSAHPERLRLTTFSKVLEPDYSNRATWDAQHYTWLAITHNMHMTDGASYAHTTTIDGRGNPVTFPAGIGVLDWLSQQSKSVLSPSDTPTDDDGFVNPLGNVLAFIKNLFMRLLDAIRSMLSYSPAL